MSNTAMYIFVNKGLQMTVGKVAAQAAHAAIEAWRISNVEMLGKWYEGKHYTKLVMEARDEDHLKTIATYLQDRGYKSTFIIDEGRNEVARLSFTALGVEIVDRDDPNAKATFSTFKLYRDKIRMIIEADK